MAITLISYATPEYTRARKFLFSTAKKHGVDKCIAFNREDLQKTEFYKSNKHILDSPRGNGYWLWKPYFIVQELRKLSIGEYLVYADAGIFFRKNISALINLLKEQHDTAFFYNNFRMGSYTKRDVFVALDCDAKEYYEAPMVHAGFQIYKKTEASMQFAEEVLKYSATNGLITDEENVGGLPNVDGFVENRHDQSILSLLIHKHRKRVFVDPSQFLVRWADFELGKGDIEHQQLPYDRIIYIHRYRNSEIWKLVPDTLKKIFRIS